MNCRQKEKHFKKKQIEGQDFVICGNNFGDCLHLRPLKHDRTYCYCSCSGVVMLNQIIPNEFLSILINNCILEYGSVENFLKNINYDEEYKKKLLSRIGENHGNVF